MKTWVKILLPILAVILVAILIISGLWIKTVKDIKEAFINNKYANLDSEIWDDPSFNPLTVKDVKINHYLGRYNGSLAVMIRGSRNPSAASYGVRVAGIYFEYGFSVEEIMIYKEGYIFRLTKAYELGILTKTDLEKLSERYYALYPNPSEYRP